MTSKSNEFACDRIEVAAMYALQALPASEVAAFENHLHACSACRHEVESLGSVVGSFVGWPLAVLRPPSSLWHRLAERIGAEPQTTAVAPMPWQEPEWEQPSRGIFCKLLATDTERDRVSMLVRLEPGVDYPPHRHGGVEELHLLDGELWINERKLCAGDYNRAEPGTADRRVWSETGCTCLLITSTRDVLG